MSSESQSPEQSIAATLAEVADRRREQARQEIEQRKAPNFILEILQTEVQYVISPTFLPFEQMDILIFTEKLKNLYGLRRVDPDLQKYASPLALLRSGGPEAGLVFDDGRFKVSSQDFIPIKRLRLHSEGIHVILTGPSTVAEIIISDVIEQLWASAGVSKSWKDIQAFIQLKAYGCGTIVDLGYPLAKLLGTEFRNTLDGNFVSGNKFAQRMAPVTSLSGFSAPEQLVAGYVVDDINLMFNVYNPSSGLAHQVKLRLGINAKHLYGSNRCTVVSQLPFESHVEAVDTLRKLFPAAG